MGKKSKEKKIADCYVCKDVKANGPLIFLFRDANGTVEEDLPICNTCRDNYKTFNKVLMIFMMFTTFVFMSLISFVAYLYLDSGDTQTALYTFIFIVPVSFIGFYLHKRLYHGSHFVQKAAREPAIKSMLERGYKGFVIAQPK